jgi:hypothetical protein
MRKLRKAGQFRLELDLREYFQHRGNDRDPNGESANSSNLDQQVVALMIPRESNQDHGCFHNSESEAWGSGFDCALASGCSIFQQERIGRNFKGAPNEKGRTTIEENERSHAQNRGTHISIGVFFINGPRQPFIPTPSPGRVNQTDSVRLQVD